MTTTKINFHNFPIGTKVQTTDKDGYFVMNACGFISEHLPEGNAIIKAFDGYHYSTVSQYRIFEVEILN